MAIHPSALVDPAAELGRGVEVGPFALVEAGTVLADGVRVEAHGQVLCGTRLGAGAVVGRGAIVGGLPQDLGFDPRTPTGVEVGARSILREHVTIHRSTREGEPTRLGEGNYLMVGAHLGHDVQMGDGNILANGVLVAGHVRWGSRTVVGGGAVFHQFLRVGDHAMIQGNGSFSRDVPPFTLAMRINRVVGLNSVGLRRSGFSAAERADLKELFDLVWLQGKNLTQALAAAEGRSWSAAPRRLLDFLKAPSKKGVCDNRGHE